MSESQQWPDWQDVANGLAVAGAHVCAWPTPSYGRPMLALHQKHKPRRLIRIEFGPNTGSVAGYQCFKGTNYLVVYEDEIQAIRAKLPTEKDKMLLGLATEQFEQKLAEHMKDTRAASREEALKTFFPTVWNILSSQFGMKTGYPKVLSLEVCPDPVPPPETPQSAAERATALQAEVMGRAIANAQRGTKGRQAEG